MIRSNYGISLRFPRILKLREDKKIRQICTSKKIIDLYKSQDFTQTIDFENVKPTAEEQEIWEKVDNVLSKSAGIIKAIGEYKGCEELIRKAISEVSPENEEECWKQLLPKVDDIADAYFMAKYARGLICMPMDESYSDRYNLPQMCIVNTDNHTTAFSVSPLK